MTNPRRGDVVLVAFPFVSAGTLQRKLRPAVVVQADRYNGRRDAVILAAVTTAGRNRRLPCKVAVPQESPAGRAAGFRTDSVIDGQTLVTIPQDEIVRSIGRLAPETLKAVDHAVRDALGL